MQLFIVILAISFLQVWGTQNPLHKDQWFNGWVAFVNGYDRLSKSGMGQLLIILGAPLVLFILLSLVLNSISPWLLLPLGVVILLYGFGRGEFNDLVEEYTDACRQDDWEEAVSQAQALGVPVDDVQAGDWSELHKHFLDEASYRGFERMFAVLFWFLVLGPLGALLYRLARLYLDLQTSNSDLVTRLLWIIEWPAVRVLGFSLAFTGNFIGCYHRWNECIFCVERSTKSVLGKSVLGALSVDDNLEQTCEVTQKELCLLVRLFTRTLWFWLAIVGAIVLVV